MLSFGGFAGGKKVICREEFLEKSIELSLVFYQEEL